jgi:hypothetical protein
MFISYADTATYSHERWIKIFERQEWAKLVFISFIHNCESKARTLEPKHALRQCELNQNNIVWLVAVVTFLELRCSSRLVVVDQQPLLRLGSALVDVADDVRLLLWFIPAPPPKSPPVTRGLVPFSPGLVWTWKGQVFSTVGSYAAENFEHARPLPMQTRCVGPLIKLHTSIRKQQKEWACSIRTHTYCHTACIQHGMEKKKRNWAGIHGVGGGDVPHSHRAVAAGCWFHRQQHVGKVGGGEQQ